MQNCLCDNRNNSMSICIAEAALVSLLCEVQQGSILMCFCQQHVAHNSTIGPHLPLDSTALAWQLRVCPSVQTSPACCC